MQVCEGSCDLRRYLLLKSFKLHLHVLKLLSGVQKLFTFLLSEKQDMTVECYCQSMRLPKIRTEDVMCCAFTRMKLYTTHECCTHPCSAFNSLYHGRSFRAVSILQLVNKSFNGGNLLTSSF